MEYMKLKLIFSNLKHGRSSAQMAFTVMNGQTDLEAEK